MEGGQLGLPATGCDGAGATAAAWRSRTAEYAPPLGGLHLAGLEVGQTARLGVVLDLAARELASRLMASPSGDRRDAEFIEASAQLRRSLATTGLGS